MQFLPMMELLKAARADGYAVPSFCVWSAEMVACVLGVASDLRAPVILMNGPGEQCLVPATDMGAMIQAVARRFPVPAALHLDHGDSVDLVRESLAAGYTSVMLDYSSRAFAENVAALRQVVELARPKGVTVEGEIGHVGRADDVTGEGCGVSSLTEVAEAVEYVQQTQVDCLAVSIGNAHGQYTKLPQLDFQRLEEIYAAIQIPIVLHGGSGTPEADLRRAIALGIAKVNVATELVTALRHSLLEQWQAKQNLWMPMAQSAGIQAMAPVVEKWLRVTGAAGRA